MLITTVLILFVLVMSWIIIRDGFQIRMLFVIAVVVLFLGCVGLIGYLVWTMHHQAG